MFTLFWACPNLPKLSRPHNNSRFDKKCPKTLRLLSYRTLCLILFVIFNQKICFIFGQIMSHLFIVRRCNILFDIQIKLVEKDNNVSHTRNSLKEVSQVSWTLFVKIGHCASDVYLLEKNAYLELSCACLTTINNTTDCCSTTLPLF